jgi:hypothetical protein
MSRSHEEERFPYALQEVADALREERSALTPLELDRVKLRAMNGARRSASSRDKGFVGRSRFTALVTVGFLALGTGGAFAVGGDDLGLGGRHGRSASESQYRPGNGFGDKNHIHTGPPGHR